MRTLFLSFSILLFQFPVSMQSVHSICVNTVSDESFVGVQYILDHFNLLDRFLFRMARGILCSYCMCVLG